MMSSLILNKGCFTEKGMLAPPQPNSLLNRAKGIVPRDYLHRHGITLMFILDG